MSDAIDEIKQAAADVLVLSKNLTDAQSISRASLDAVSEARRNLGDRCEALLESILADTPFRAEVTLLGRTEKSKYGVG